MIRWKIYRLYKRIKNFLRCSHKKVVKKLRLLGLRTSDCGSLCSDHRQTNVKTIVNRNFDEMQIDNLWNKFKRNPFL